MRDVLTFDRVGLREVDRRAVEEFGIPILVLMENAGRAVAEVVRQHCKPGARVLIVCGPGNNGGDGLVAARHLHNHGVPVQIFLLGAHEAFREAAAAQLAIVEKMRLPIAVVTDPRAELRDWVVEGGEHDVVVDALFGTGLSRAVEGVPRQMIEAINASKRLVISVDIPSGLDCDTGQPLGAAIMAGTTVSFCGLKVGFAHAKTYVGKVQIADIGAPRGLLKQCAK